MLYLLREERFEHTPARALCCAMAGLFRIATGKHIECVLRIQLQRVPRRGEDADAHAEALIWLSYEKESIIIVQTPLDPRSG